MILLGLETQDPNIKSVVLYQLSYGIIRANPELSVLVVQMYRKFLFCQNKTIFLYGILIIVNLLNKINFMCKALIIGAGGVGTVVAQKIAANPIFRT